MKIWLISDWHAERGSRSLEDQLRAGSAQADVCVVPGDMDIGHLAVEALARIVAPRMPVVYVPGNHCYRGQDQGSVRRRMREAAELHRNMHVLDPGTVVLEGTRFVGATLWTDFEVGGPGTDLEAMDLVRHRYSGGSTIDCSGGPAPWTPEHAVARHREELEYLGLELKRPFDGRTVVVTHHAPHKGSIHPRFLHSGLQRSAAYASDLDPFVREHAPLLWLHGHVHDSTDYFVGPTRIVANPRGYDVRSTTRDGIETIEFPTDVVVRSADHDRVESYCGPENRSHDPWFVVETNRGSHVAV